MDSHSAPDQVSITELTETVLKRYSNDIHSKQIRVEMELQQLSAKVNKKSIILAVCDLLENAITTTPLGGELNVTLINGETCWELEIADSANHLADLQLNHAWTAAKIHGGSVQTLACPQGGTANVLVIPQDHSTGNAL